MTGLHTRSEQLDASTIRVGVEWHAAAVSMRAAFALLSDDADFRRGLVAALRAAPFEAYFWETPPVTEKTSDRLFEFVLVDAPALGRVTPDRSAFETHFAKDADGDGVVTFENLGRDATLIVPCPTHDERAYAHLAVFLREGPNQQVDALFKSVGEASYRRLSSRPQWLSTAGMGVSWLHVRIDSTPKYYRHAPYKKPPRPE